MPSIGIVLEQKRLRSRNPGQEYPVESKLCSQTVHRVFWVPQNLYKLGPYTRPAEAPKCRLSDSGKT